MPTASNERAAEIALLVQRVIRGENLEDVDSELAARFKERMAKHDRDANEYEARKEQFITETFDELRSNRPTGEELAREQAKGAKKVQHSIKEARQRAAKKRQWMQHQIKHGPKVDCYVEPKIVSGILNGMPAQEIVGLTVGINGVAMYLAPGHHKVHPIIAERVQQMQRCRQEVLKRQKTLGPNKQGMFKEWHDVARGMAEIDAEFGSSSGPRGESAKWDDPTLMPRG